MASAQNPQQHPGGGDDRPEDQQTRAGQADQDPARTAAHDWQVPGSAPVGIVTAIDPILRDSLVTGLMLDVPGSAGLRYELDVETAVLRRLVVTERGVVEHVVVELEHP